MKHLLNNISEEEKNSIREQYTATIKVSVDKFKTLQECKLGDVKPLLVKEQKDSADISSIYGQIVKAVKPLGTDEDKLINAIYNLKSVEDFIQLTKMFADKKTGYSSFDDMINGEMEKLDNYQEVKKIRDKLTTLGIEVFFKSYANIFGEKLFDGGFKSKIPAKPVPKTKYNSVGSFCKSKWEPLLPKAKKYWIEWLSNPITKVKFKNNWKIKNYYELLNIFKKYIDAINKIKLVYYDKYISGGAGDDAYESNAYAFISSKFPDRIYINCSKDDKNKYDTLVHEIQHILYDIKPLNPAKQVGDVFVNDQTKLMKLTDFVELSYEDIKKGRGIKRNMISASKNYSLDIDDLDYWSNKAYKYDDVGYICRETEKMSNIMAIRKALNIKPGEDITVEMVKPYIEGKKWHTDVTWILMCWALNGFGDIDVMLNKMNRLAIQNTKNDGESTFA